MAASSTPPSPTPPLMAILLLLLLVLVGAVDVCIAGDVASDKQACQDTLLQMVTCLPYVQGSAAVPTPDCCDGLNQVVAKSPKCLCILIKDRNDPSLDLKVDLTRALTLQSRCKAPGDTSLCPKLLNLDPRSPEAQVFKQFGSAKNGTTTNGRGTGGVAPSTNSTSSSSGKSTSSNATTTVTSSSSSSSSSSSRGGTGRSNHYRGGVEVFCELWTYCLALLVVTLIVGG